MGSSANMAPNLSTSLSTSQEKLLPPPPSLTTSMGFYNTVPSLPVIDPDLNQLGVPTANSPYSSDYMSNNSMFTHLPPSKLRL